MKVEYTFFVEDVLKGNKFFNAGDTIIIKTVLGGPENPRPELYLENTYLLPLKPWIISENYTGDITFYKLQSHHDVWDMSKPRVFPIENEIIKNVEYFGIKDTSWTDFKKFFKETYLIFN